MPNLGIGGTERWALALMSGLPEVDWSVSVPDVVAGSAPHAEFAALSVIPEAQASGCSDVLVTSWGFHRPAAQPVISVSHAVFPAYREMMRATPHDHAVAVSKAAGSVFEDGEPVTTIYNGVDFARLAPSASAAAVRERLAIPGGATVVGYVGRWGRQKNPIACAVAASTVPGGIALYVGPTPESHWLEEAEGLADVRIVPPELGIPIGDLYRAMDVCIVPSRSEGFSLAIAEAWFCEIPVLATSVGIGAEYPEFLTPLPQEPARAVLREALAVALSKRGSEELQQAKRMVESTFSVERMATDWRAFLSSRFPGLFS